ncbi:MAG TPA: PIN domain-containing protein [Verrucomicrobiota bacterium]|nr:hypothetical protein [Verrucomicrobiales bacterium]HRI11447.1 PIN domain-containing protein [Verrucomicrobiota bacterium]
MSVRTVMVDSSVLIDLLRRGLDPALELRQRARTMDLATCGMVRLEVLRGIVRAKARDAMEGFFNVMCCASTDNRLWDEAAHLAWTLDRQGWTLPSTDLIIAVCARRIGAAVLTLDSHFFDIPDLPVMSSLDELR